MTHAPRHIARLLVPDISISLINYRLPHDLSNERYTLMSSFDINVKMVEVAMILSGDEYFLMQ